MTAVPSNAWYRPVEEYVNHMWIQPGALTEHHNNSRNRKRQMQSCHYVLCASVLYLQGTDNPRNHICYFPIKPILHTHLNPKDIIVPQSSRTTIPALPFFLSLEKRYPVIIRKYLAAALGLAVCLPLFHVPNQWNWSSTCVADGYSHAIFTSTSFSKVVKWPQNGVVGLDRAEG